jgi:hypothetical protein
LKARKKNHGPECRLRVLRCNGIYDYKANFLRWVFLIPWCSPFPIEQVRLCAKKRRVCFDQIACTENINPGRRRHVCGAYFIVVWIFPRGMESSTSDGIVNCEVKIQACRCDPIREPANMCLTIFGRRKNYTASRRLQPRFD